MIFFIIKFNLEKRSSKRLTQILFREPLVLRASHAILDLGAPLAISSIYILLIPLTLDDDVIQVLEYPPCGADRFLTNPLPLPPSYSSTPLPTKTQCWGLKLRIN